MDINSPIIDIVIPNRNKAAFLPRTIASLRNQTETRWRAIVIDGESNDGSLEILRQTAQEDPRFVIRTAPPISLSGLSLYRSWNHGLLFVRAPFFAVLTSDDIWEPDWLEQALKGLAANPTAMAVVARTRNMNESDQPGDQSVFSKQFEAAMGIQGTDPCLLSSRSCTLAALLLGPIFTTIHSMVLRSSLLDDGLLFTEDTGFAADIEYYLHTCMLGDILYLPANTAWFRFYPEQASGVVRGMHVHHLWRKIVERNRKLVSRHTGVPREQIAAVASDVLNRHQLIMTKPAKQTLRANPLLAGWQMLQAAATQPALWAEYVFRHRSSKESFFLGYSTKLAQKTIQQLQPKTK